MVPLMVMVEVLAASVPGAKLLKVHCSGELVQLVVPPPLGLVP